MKKWLLLESSKQEKKEDIIDILLKNRGIRSEKEKEEFLNPSLEKLSWEKVGLNRQEMEKAVLRIKKAIKNEESIIVYTDYDADGVASGTIIWETLYEMGAKVLPYVPHRIEEGYGLSEKGIDAVHKQHQAKLIITVDHGVTAWEKVKYAKKLGIDVIILDHHTLPAKLPQSEALVHTTEICATGVAWFFANYLITRDSGRSAGWRIARMTNNLDLVALATIADLIPLIGTNRILVKYGLEQLNKTERPGFKALIKTSGLRPGNLGVYEVGHMLAPRINASGRLTHALDSLRLLCTKDMLRAELLAQNLTNTNRDRQLILEEMTDHAKGMVRQALKGKLIFIAEESYNQGVIGLVAGRLVDEFYLPAIVISKGEKYSKASARSVSGFNIVEAIRSCSELLVDAGGHPMAAGFTVETAKLVLLERKLTKLVEKQLTEEKMQRVLKIDCEINLEHVDLKLFENIKTLEPFGIGNPQPTFVSKNIKVVKMRLIGKDKKHIKLTLQPDQKYHQYINAIGFGMGELFEKLSFDKLIDIVYTIDEDNWNNNQGLQLKLKDVKFPQ